MSVGRTVSPAGSMRLGTLAGIELRVHLLFVLWVGLHLVESADLLGALVFDVILFGSVLLHELGHCLAARLVGGQALAIVLYPFGGASLLRTPRTPGAELISTGAGPLVNLVLAVVAVAAAAALGVLGAARDHPGAAFGLGSGAGQQADRLANLVFSAALVNAALFAFNVIPAYPMDGGRLLRAALWPLLGWRRATVATTVLALLLAAACAALAALFGELYLLLVALFVGVASWSELQRALAASDQPPTGDPSGALLPPT